MGYVGNAPAEKYTTIDKQTLTGNSTVGPYTLTHSVGNEQEIEVFVNNVRQEPSVSYTVSSNQLTMSASVASADDFYVIFQGKAKMTATHPPTFDLTAANGTFTGTVTTGGLTVGSDTAKTKFYSNSTYNGIYNGSALTNNESIYMGSGTLFFYSGGGERMRIDSGGKVGIGTIAPDLALHVEGTNAAPASSGSTPTGFVSLRQKDGGASHGANIGVLGVPPWGTWIQGQDANNLATNYPLLLNPNGGNVGIGTSSPSGLLHLSANTNDTTLPSIVLQDTGTTSTRLGVLTNTSGDINLSATSSLTDIRATVSVRDDRTILFNTAGSEAMRIDSSGNVGIGTSSPSYKLEVTGDVDTWVTRIYNTGSDANAQGLLVRSDATAAHDAFALGVYADSGYKFVVKSSGYVGIGTSSPYGRFTIKTSGNGYVDGLIFEDADSTTRSAITHVNGTTYFSGNTAADHMVLTSSGNVGIGSSNPLYRLAVEDGSGATRVNIRNTANAGPGSGIFFEVLNGGSTVGNGTIATQSNGDMAFFTGTSSGTERWRINTAGHMVPANINNGIILGSTASVASNLLNDYEEGTWTPTVSNHTGSTSGQAIAGVYVKVGNICHFQGVLTQGNGSVIGTMTLGGFPFTAAGTYGHISINTSASNQIQMSACRVVAGANAFTIKEFDGDDVNSGSGAVNICFQGSFQVA